MRQKGLNFVERNPSHPHYQQVVLPKVGFYRIPTVEMPDGAVVQDTSEIIDYLEGEYPDRPVYPEGVRQRLAALIIEVYADEGMLPAGLHYRWSFRDQNDPFVIDEFGTGAGGKTPKEVKRFGEATADRIVSSIAHLGVTEAMAPAIEESTEELFRLLNSHFRDHACLFGGRASIADVALMGPLYGHFERDPYPANLMRRIAPRLMRWTERMNAREFPPAEFPDAEDAFYPDDHIPETTMSVLKLLAQDFFPEVDSLLDVYSDWAVQQKDVSVGTAIKSLPNGAAICGMNQFQLRNRTMKRIARIDSVWKWQRPLEFYQGLSGEDRKTADAFLSDLGGWDLFQKLPVPPVSRNDRNLFIFSEAISSGS